MVIVKIMGGLGNQMFQYAAGRALAIHKNEKLVLDTTFYKEKENSVTPRQFELDVFNIQAKITSTSKLKMIYKNYSNRIKRKLKLKNHKIIYTEKNYQSAFNIKKNAYLDGYFRSEEYFKNIKNIILKDFSPIKDLELKYKEILNLICESESVSIHIRRGDYAENPMVNQNKGLCPLSYYVESVNYMKKEILKPVFFVFSDDIEWVKNNLHIAEQTEYVSDINVFQDYEEMYIMSQCKHNIIANSTFSWWGAWLNQNPQKIITAPKKWFSDEKNMILI